ncbi:MAG: nucleoside 2-deoxyribosyltransferase [Parcubacteria group bacterium]|nr:nucleoside 2-deoxyribosyltransferase [Parcubacteria group bacterium]
MKTIYLCAPIKLGELNHQLIKKIEKAGFKVLCAMVDTAQDLSYKEIFARNVDLIKQSDLLVVVLKDYGKDLTAEVGMAYGLGKPMIGINYNADKEDVMCYYALDEIIKPEAIESVLKKYLKS